jgi:hypothetical protein
VFATLTIDDRRFELTETQDLDALRQALVSASRSTGFVAVGVRGGWEVQVMVTPHTSAVISSRDTSPEERDDAEVSACAGVAWVFDAEFDL